MRVRRALAAATCLLAQIALVQIGAAPSVGEELRSALDAALDQRALRGARVAALVVSARDGRELFAREPDRPLVPASNQKILTAVAALSRFGPTHRFRTEVLVDAAPDSAGRVDFLAVRGGGDPSLTSEDLWRLAADLRALGLRRVARGLLLDDHLFDRQRWNPTWGETGARAYHAPVSALTANYGAFSVYVQPGDRPGQPVGVTLDPPVEFLRVRNQATTRARGARVTLAVERSRAAGAEEVRVRGGAPAGGRLRSYRRSVLDATRYAGALLRLQLGAVGIAVEGETRVGLAPDTATSLLSFEGSALAEIVRLFMKWSNNQMGEALVKNLAVAGGAAPGSWESGMPALRQQLGGLGIPLEGAILVDGSGLSYDNRVAPRTLVGALRVAQQSFDFGPEFVASLPIASGDGTLEERAPEAAGAVRAKTGLLTRVTALSGYARLPDGEMAVFSVLVNGFRSSPDAAMRALDAFVSALVRGGGSARPAQLELLSGTTSS